MKAYKVLWLFALGIFFSVAAFGARFPNAVEKRIVLTGQSVFSVSELFGLNSSTSTSISLQLGRGDAWAVYLLKQDTKERLWNDNDYSPTRFNVVELSSSPVPSLTIYPYWLDLGSQLPETKVGYYSFSSPFVPENLEKDDPWTRLLRRLKTESSWDDVARMQLQRCFTFSDGIELCIEVISAVDYAANKARKGHIVTITTHLKNAAPALVPNSESSKVERQQ